MNMFDEARSILGMLNLKSMTQKELAKFLGVSQSFISNKIRLLRFPSDAQTKIIKNGLSERHARTLLRLPEHLLGQAIENISLGEMTVMESEIMVDCMLEDEILSATYEEPSAERICRFERGITRGIDNLRRFGILAKASYEKVGEKLIISIAVG